MAFIRSLKFKFSVMTVLVSYVIIVVVFALSNILSLDKEALEIAKFKEWYLGHVQNKLVSYNEQVFDIDNKVALKQYVSDHILGEKFMNQAAESTQQWQINIKNFALVDEHSILFAQWGQESLKNGDVGGQLPLLARDDLADALTGRYNSGIEFLDQNHVLVILPLKNDGKIIGATISEQVWQRPLFEVSRWQLVKSLPLQQLLLISLLPLVLVIIVIMVMLIYSTRLAKGYVSNFQTTAECWARGDLSPRIVLDGPQEISRSFQQLNSIVEKLQKVLSVERKLQRLKDRTRLANQLHDTVKQSLFANNLTLATCQKSIAHGDLQGAGELINKAISNNQVAFEQVNLLIKETEKESDYIRKKEFIAKLTDITQRCDFEIEIVENLKESLGFEVADVLLNALQEGLQNINKHVKPRIQAPEQCHARISITQSASSVCLVLADDGGPLSKVVEPGQGLSLIQQSAKLINGEFQFCSYLNDRTAGMKLIVNIPIEGAN
ncbi:sensor histidine kinase [Thalassotalea ganghwensis]